MVAKRQANSTAAVGVVGQRFPASRTLVIIAYVCDDGVLKDADWGKKL